MNEINSDKFWWQQPISYFPQEFQADQRLMEEHRLRVTLKRAGQPDDAELWQRLRRAATVLETTLLDGDYASEPLGVWRLISLIYEADGIIEENRRDYLWMLAALTWQLAEAPSIAMLLASRLRDIDTYKSRDIIEQMALAFSRRKFDELNSISEKAIAEGERTRRIAATGQQPETFELIETTLLLSIGSAMRDISSYVLGRNNKLSELTGLEDFLMLARTTGQSRRFRVGRLLVECVKLFYNSACRLLIESRAFLPSSVKEQVHKYLLEYAELWPSQCKAIEMGLLDRDRTHFVVAMPTSSGKTLCAELAIVQELSEKPDTICFYIVPTRALVTEKQRELSQKLRRTLDIKVAGATAALQQDELEEGFLKGAQVIICTPEKLDLLIRHKDELFLNATLFVIDEAHMIDDENRGLGLEFVVVRLLLLRPDARILLLSAMLPNANDFSRWLSNGQALRPPVTINAEDSGRWMLHQVPICTTNWRPTRQRFGELSFIREQPRGCHLELTLYEEPGDGEDVRIELNKYRNKPKNLEVKVVRAVEAILPKGSVMVFCMSRRQCEDIVQEMVKVRQGQSEEQNKPDLLVEALRRKIRREIAEDFLLEKALGYGIAYHHADLPPRIRVDLEGLIEKGLIEVIVCTTTLAEGVNLPVSTVIFAEWMTKANPKEGRYPKPLDLSKFRNIAGRAGRALKEVEGLVLFLDPSGRPVKHYSPRGQVINKQSPRQYFIREQYPGIRSRFLDIIEHYLAPSDDLLDQLWDEGDLSLRDRGLRQSLRQFGISVLHALETIGHLGDDAMIDGLADLSLGVTQNQSVKPAARRWLGQWVSFYRRRPEIKEELRPLAMQIGLPLRAVQRLYSVVISDSAVVDAFSIVGANDSPLLLSRVRSSDLRLSAQQISIASRVITQIDELDWEPQEISHGRLLTAWLDGAPMTDLAGIYGENLEDRKRLIERTCSYVMQKLSNSAAWGAYALRRILEIVIPQEKLSPLAKQLPLLVYFGVNSVPAALFCLMELERIDSIRLANAWLSESNDAPTIATLKEWAVTYDLNELTRILRGQDNRDIDMETFRLLRVT